MFFIPFLGAAVSGQNRTIPGWKKAIVSLAGPLPGILLGAALGVAAMTTGTVWMRKCALFLVLINAFNLAPILPLDGGRFLHVTLFCRNRWLDILFRLAAIVGLIVLAAIGFGKVLGYVAILLAVGLPVAFKLGRVTDRFKRDPPPPPAPGEDHIPLTASEPLITAVKTALPKAGNRIVATHVLNIYETLNARPPSIPASVGLFSLYGGAILVSIVCVFALVLASRGDLGSFFSLAMSAPRDKVRADSVEVWRGTAAAPAKYFLVTTLKTPVAARAEFVQATHALPADATAILFGDLTIVEFPAEQEAESRQWFREFSGQSSNTFVSSNTTIFLTVSFIAPTRSTATNLEQDLREVFEAGVDNLVPPWDPAVESPEFAPHREARRAWFRIQREINQVWEDQLKTNLATLTANKKETMDETLRRLKEHHETVLSLQDKARDRLAAEYAATPYVSLVKWNGQLAQTNLTNSAERTAILSKVAEKLGRSAGESEGEPTGGGVERSGQLLVADVTIRSPEINLPELVAWLTRQHCTPIRYRFQPVGDDDN
jgi:hypothetical protein